MLSDADFQFIAQEAAEHTGAALTPQLSGLIEQRLGPLARREGLETVGELITRARARGEARIAAAIAEALLQTETRFFRDRGEFHRLREDILPAIAQRRNGVLRIWCAGAGTGQEAYSVAMLIEDMREDGAPLAVEILATDISERLLDKARAGLYTQFEVQRGLPIRKLIAHFEKAGDLWRASDRLRASVRFAQHNLMSGAGDHLPFDLIVCRHVLSTFGADLKARVAEQLDAALDAGGVLMLGAGETLPEGANPFTHAEGAFVRKSLARRAA